MTRSLSPLTLKPLATERKAMRPALAKLRLGNFNGSVNLSATFFGRPGDLLIATGSVDQTGNYVLGVEPQIVVSATSRQLDEHGHAFKLTQTKRSAIIRNAAGERAGVTLVVAGGTYNPVTATCGTTCVTCCGYNGFVFSPSAFYCPVDWPMSFAALGTDCNGDKVQLAVSAWRSSNTSVATINSSGLMNAIAVGSVNISATLDPLVATSGTICFSGGTAYCPTAAPTAGGSGAVVPVITSISPSTILAGSNNVQFTISGSGFGASPTVNLPSGVTSSNQTASNTSISMKLSVAATVTIGGTGNVSVTASSKTSNAKQLTFDGPNYMEVIGDVSGYCKGCSTILARFTTYRVFNQSGSVATSIPIGEALTESGWNCNQQDPGATTTHCGSGVTTDSGGEFMDAWSLGSDGYTPSGCGTNGDTDHWQWFPAPHTFGRLTGWVHTDAVRINGYTLPPSQLPVGTIINP